MSTYHLHRKHSLGAIGWFQTIVEVNCTMDTSGTLGSWKRLGHVEKLSQFRELVCIDYFIVATSRVGLWKLFCSAAGSGPRLERRRRRC